MLRVAERNLKDARIRAVSADGRFRFAYEAAIALATIPLYCAGFRTTGMGHHQTTLQALPLIMGAEVSELAAYFDSCRTKRNVSTYDRSGQISEAEAKELFREATKFKEAVEIWLRINHPGLVAP